jgi:hypothetical protein
MQPTVSPALIAAYRQTRFRCELPDGPVELQVDRPDLLLDRQMRAASAASAAIVTAFNPQSLRCAEADNRIAHRLLLAAVDATGWQYFGSAAIDPTGTWPVEEGLLVFGIGREEAVLLARAFRQNAIVFIGADTVPRLVMCG